MKKILLLGLLTVLMAFSAKAQQYFQNTMFPFTQFAYNPAAAGAKKLGMADGSMLTFMGRLQWLGFEGAPKTTYISYDGDLPSNAGYIGALLSVDAEGPFTFSTLTASYAYQFNVGTNMQLRIGANGGIKQLRLDPSKFEYKDQNDQVIPTSVTGTIIPALGAGAYFTGTHPGAEQDLKFFAGLSAQNLLEPSWNGLLLNGNGESEDVRTFMLSGGYNFKLSERMFIMPSAMVMTDLVLAPQASVNVLWTYKPLSVGINYRFYNESVGAMAGFQINENMFLGYSYDYPTTTLNASGDINTHELVLTYRLGGPRNNLGNKGQDILKDADGDRL